MVFVVVVGGENIKPVQSTHEAVHDNCVNSTPAGNVGDFAFISNQELVVFPNFKSVTFYDVSYLLLVTFSGGDRCSARLHTCPESC